MNGYGQTPKPTHRQPLDVCACYAGEQQKNQATYCCGSNQELAWMLSEKPLAESQMLTSDPEEVWYQLEAEVPDDGQTFWWLLAQSTHVDVLEPKYW